MTARCVTARAGPAAGWVVALHGEDERKQAAPGLVCQSSDEKRHLFSKRAAASFTVA